MNSVLIVGIFAALCCSLVKGQVTCFQCDYSTFIIDSETQVYAGDDTCDGAWSTDKASASQTCSASWCYKITFSQNSDTYTKTTRGCASDCTEGALTVGDFTGYKYCCQSGKCNGASALAPHHLAFVLAAISAVSLIVFGAKSY